MSARILILSNDAFRVKAKTCESLAAACRRLGHFALVRDTSDARFAIQSLQNGKSADLEEFRSCIASKIIRQIDYFGIDTILSLDLDWLLVPDEILGHHGIKKIYSLWFDDVRTWLHGANKEFFPSKTFDIKDILSHPKVHHCFYSKGQTVEAALYGIVRSQVSFLAADRELLGNNFPIEFPRKIAFIGNPGCRNEPHPEIVKQMIAGADLDTLRALSREWILRFPPREIDLWSGDEPSVRGLLEFATQMRVMQPYRPAGEIFEVASIGFPDASAYLRERNFVGDFLVLIKLVNQYDRPAFASRLYRKGLVDIYSAENEWAPYDVKSKPFVSAREIASIYQQYPLHLNAANPLRDATANEKLFEISACARASINLDTPDIRECYDEQETAFVLTLRELEERSATLLSSPQMMTDLGASARKKTSDAHTWDHRLQSLLS